MGGKHLRQACKYSPNYPYLLYSKNYYTILIHVHLQHNNKNKKFTRE